MLRHLDDLDESDKEYQVRSSIRHACVLPVLLVLLMAVGAPALAQDNSVRMAKVKISDYVVSCTGDTLSGSVEIISEVALDAAVVLYTKEGDKARFQPQPSRTTVFAVSAGADTYNFVVHAGGLPPTVTAYRVEVEVLDKERKKHVAVSECAPPAVVPEVPAALLVPLSLAATGAVVLARARRER